jgi:hypothetical protein
MGMQGQFGITGGELGGVLRHSRHNLRVRRDFCIRLAIVRIGRGERIRTSDPLVPNQVLYQAEPRPVTESNSIFL